MIILVIKNTVLAESRSTPVIDAFAVPLFWLPLENLRPVTIALPLYSLLLVRLVSDGVHCDSVKFQPRTGNSCRSPDTIGICVQTGAVSLKHKMIQRSKYIISCWTVEKVSAWVRQNIAICYSTVLFKGNYAAFLTACSKRWSRVQ